MIVVDSVTKRFGTVTALDELSFTVRPGHVTAFLGPNGAGKTTMMRVILGLDAPTIGSATIDGKPYASLKRPLRRVGALLDANAVHSGRSAWDHLLSIAQSNGLGRARVDELLSLVGLDGVGDRRVGEYSLGMRQRLGVAAALLGDPSTLIFDEPVNGLDPDGVVWIRELFRGLADEGRTVFVSSQLMGEVALTADRLIIIGRGRLLIDSPTAGFVADHTASDVLVRSPKPTALGEVLARQGATVLIDGDTLIVTGMAAADIATAAASQLIPVHELTPRHGSLEDAYLRITGTSVEYAARARARSARTQARRR